MKYEYMKESEKMLQYFQFPKFLLKLRISQTAKFLYMICMTGHGYRERIAG